MTPKQFHQTKRLEAQFNSTFKTQLRHFFINVFLGYDIGKFDTFLQVPDGVSMKEHVTEKYGEEGLFLVEKIFLIN
jgi:hypothetical protein